MKSILYLMLACIALGGLLAPTAEAKNDEIATSNSIKKNLQESRRLIIQLSDMVTGEADRKVVADFVATQKHLEGEQEAYAESLPGWAKSMRESSNEFNKFVRLYNQKCSGSRHSACQKARKEIDRLRAILKSERANRGKNRKYGLGLLKRTTGWRTNLAKIIADLTKEAEETGPVEEFSADSAAAFAAANSGSATTFQSASSATSLAQAGSRTSGALDSVPAGLPADAEPDPLAEEPIEQAAESGWRWERVRVRQRFGPFRWCRWCCRKVKTDK